MDMIEACIQADVQMWETAIAAGAKFDARWGAVDFEGWTCLHILAGGQCRNEAGRDAMMTTVVTKYPTLATTRNFAGRYPAWQSANLVDFSALKILAPATPHPWQGVDFRGEDAYHMCFVRNSLELCKFLESSGAPAEKMNQVKERKKEHILAHNPNQPDWRSYLGMPALHEEL